MKLETKMAVSFAIVAFAVLVISSAPAVAVVLGTFVLGLVGWHVGCVLAPKDTDRPTTYTNFEDGPTSPYGKYRPDEHQDDL